MPNLSNFPSKEARNEWYRKYRAKHREKLREYNRTYNKEWRKENGYHNEEKWIKNNRYKRNAHMKVLRAVSKGLLIKEPCEVCGSKHVHAHHEDYSKPLEVRWLCPLHHKEVHSG